MAETKPSPATREASAPTPPPAADPCRIAPLRTLVTLLLCALVVGLIYAAWQLSFLILLSFTAVVLAVVLRGVAGFLTARTGMPMGVALLAVSLGGAGLLASFVVFVLPPLGEQIGVLRVALPAQLAQAEAWLDAQPWSGPLLDGLEGGDGARDWNVFGAITGTISTVLGLFVNLLVLVSLSALLAADPATYREGALKLLPAARRDRMRAFLSVCARGIRAWVSGQIVAMAIVAALMTAGLVTLGVEPPLVLGLIAGLANVIPYLGPYLGGAPAVLMALSQGPETALAVVVLIVVVQNLEGNLITPRIQSRAIAIPPGVIIVGLTGFGILFGLLGVVLAVPILFVFVTAVRWFYVEDVLGEPPKDAP
jgi:predicted PurR-regulated permease PerM